MEEFESFRNRQPLMVGVFRDRFAFDVFHDEVRSSGVVGIGVKDFRDVRMIHQRQSLPFGFEAGNDEFRVHAQLDEFQRHFSTDGCSLFGSIDFAHTAGADAFQYAIRADVFGDRFEQIPGSVDGVGIVRRLVGDVRGVERHGLDSNPKLASGMRQLAGTLRQ